jgi:acetylornithine deacetylase
MLTTSSEPLVQLLADLVRIPSMNPMGRARSGAEYTEEPIARFVGDYMRRRGLDVELRTVAPQRLNVVARLDAGAQRTVLLEAHLDTVHADGMSVPPFSATMVDGRLQGRGACDTKGSLAAFIHAVCSLVEAKRKPRFNVVLMAVADEEYQFSGARQAVADGIRADFGICGEPTQLHIVRAHKGVMRWRVRTAGRAAHSAYPERGVNAIYRMGHVLDSLERHARGLLLGPRHPLLGTPTLSVGVIEGGQAVNIVPDSCWIELDRRMLPGEVHDVVMTDTAAVLSGLDGWSMDPAHLVAAGMDVPPTSTVVHELSGALAACGVPPVIEGAQYATDAGIYNAAGIPCVVFGPGNIADAHTATESLDLAELETATAIVRRFLA